MDADKRKAYSGHTMRTQRKQTEAPKVQYMETIVAQCIVCGIALAVILFLSVIHIPMTEDMRLAVKQSIEKQIALEDIKEIPENFDAVFVNMKNSVQTIFGDTDDGTENQADRDASDDSSGDPVSTMSDEKSMTEETPAEPPWSVQDINSRIDEDILDAMYSREEFYAQNEKKSIAPELEAAQAMEREQ